MKTIILAENYEQARLVAQSVNLGFGEWKYVKEQIQLQGIDKRTNIIAYHTAPAACLVYIKSLGMSYRLFKSNELIGAQ